MLIVQKFGGSSVADVTRIYNVADRIAATYREGHKLVVVVSAQGDTTDDLIAKAHEITDRPSRREMDMLLATGEQQSVALLAMALQSRGLPAVSLTGWQSGILTTSAHQNARVKKIDPQRLQNELERNNIVVVAGFQGYNKSDDVTTLGRGGSDTTAVALAASLSAELCEIYTDVDGVYTADPRIVATARKLDEISYDEMLEMAALGAKVLHSRSVELAKKYNVNLVVRSSLTDAPGTSVKEVQTVENVMVSGITADKNIARVTLVGVKDEPGMAYRIFSLLSKRSIAVDIIIQSMGIVGVAGTKDIMFTVDRSVKREVLDILQENKNVIKFDNISSDDSVCKLSIVGAGMGSATGVATMMFETLSELGVNIGAISSSEIKISVLVEEKDADRAANALHEAFIDTNSRFKA
ncbi:MAG: aspartate kinase [Defluviitaleaceae bacterium]|nr:aspartate kinase [Defluviitaleaceae bacterium]